MPALPAYDDQACRRIEHLTPNDFKPIRCEHILRRSRRHFREDRPPPGKTHARRARQVKNITPVQEHPENAGGADNADPSVRLSDSRQRLLEGSARRIPDQRPFIRGSAAIAGTRRDKIKRRRKGECGCCS